MVLLWDKVFFSFNLDAYHVLRVSFFTMPYLLQLHRLK